MSFAEKDDNVFDMPETETMNKTESSSTVLALPKTVSDMINGRKVKTKLSLNDQVDELHLRLYEELDYRKLLDAVYPEMAITGDLKLEDGMAAQMIVAHARENGYPYIARQKLGTVVKALNVVLRRYGMSRTERRTT